MVSARARRRIDAIRRVTGLGNHDAMQVFLVENGARPAALVSSGLGVDMTKYSHPKTTKHLVRHESDYPSVTVVAAPGTRVPKTLTKDGEWDDLKDNVVLARLLGYRNARKDFGTLKCADMVLTVRFEHKASSGDGAYEEIISWHASSVPADSGDMLRAMQAALGCPVRMCVHWERYC